jgi:hypothetical protein
MAYLVPFKLNSSVDISCRKNVAVIIWSQKSEARFYLLKRYGHEFKNHQDRVDTFKLAKHQTFDSLLSFISYGFLQLTFFLVFDLT